MSRLIGQRSKTMNQRRRSSQTSGGVVAKRAKTISDSLDDTGFESIVPDKERQGSAEVGILESIVMTNFMCHRRLKFDFCPNVNFIIGKNGSGKSAVLTAVMVGLGANASHTNRGHTIKSFIKNGCPYAEIIVRLRNVGQDAYKPDEYGTHINVERRITSAGVSTYKLRGANNQVVSSKKEELVRILDQFNIQVNNPICILNQDASRHFLHSENAKNKYKMFLQATQLDEIRKNDDNTANLRRLCSSLIEQKSKSIPLLEQEMSDWKAKWDYHLSLSVHQDKLSTLKTQLAWTHVANLEAEVEKDIEKSNKLKAQSKTIEDRIEGVKKNLADAKASHDLVAGKLGAINKELDDIRPQCGSTKKEDETAKTALRALKLEEKKINANIGQATKDKDALIKKIKQIKDAENSNEKQLRDQEIATLEEQREQLVASQTDLEHKLDALKQQVAQHNEAQYSARTEDNSLRKELEGIRRNLANLEGSRSNNLRRFGQHMPNVQHLVEQAHREGKFKQKPIGPIGAFVKVKDARYALSVESCLRRLLLSFYCDNHADERVLENIFRRAITGNARQPNIITGRFQHTPYQVDALAAFNDRYPTVLEMVDCEDPVIRNCLIDQRGIECVVMFENAAEARRVMSREPPHRCTEAFTTTGDQMYPHPNYRMYSSTHDRATLLQESVEEAIATLKEQIAVLEGNQRDVQSQLAHHRAAHTAASKETKDTELRVMRAQQDMRKLTTRIVELKNLEDPEPALVLSLEEDVEFLRVTLEELEGSYKIARAATKTQETKCAETKRLYEELEARRCTILTEQVDPLKEELGKSLHACDSAKRKVEHYVGVLRGHQTDMKAQEQRCLSKQGDVEKFSSVAASFGERPVQLQDTATVQRDIDRLEKMMKTSESRYGTMDEAQQHYLRSSERCQSVQKDITALQQYFRTIDRMVLKRNSQYGILLSYISIRISQYFVTFMNQRKFHGNLIFDHSKEMLEIEVQLPEKEDSSKSKDMKGLSGGERSYSTVSFMLSLWEAIESPFHIMDEFDVFMDMVNRRVSMDMMIEIAQNKKLNQFLFLTPLDMTKLKSSSTVKIYKMPDPDRNQTVLPFTPVDTNVNDEPMDEDD